MKTAHFHPEAQILTVPAGEFKAKCLGLLDQVLNENLKVVVTKRGKAVAEISAPKPEVSSFRSLLGRSKGTVQGDIITPLGWGDPAEKWDRISGKKRKK